MNKRKVHKWNKEESLHKLKKYYEELGRIPNRQDFKKLDLSPYYNFYYKNFGSFKNACYLAGIINEKPLTTEERLNYSIDELKELAKKLNKCPTVDEYDKNRKYGFCRKVLENHLGTCWNNICLKYIPEYELNIDRRITKTNIKEDVDYVVKKLGRTPTRKEYLEYSLKGYSMNAFNSVVGTYNEALIEFGYEPNRINGKKQTTEELLKSFLNLTIELGRVPYIKDLNDCEYTSSYNTYKKYFGNTLNICKIIGIDYNKFYKGTGAGIVSYDKSGQLCSSIPEKNISNYLIDNNIKFEKEYHYSDITGKKYKNGKRLDWIIYDSNNKYYVEYFGMYNREPRGCIDKKYNKKTKKKIKDLYKAGVIDSCIFIFPYDLENKTLDEIFGEYIDINKKVQ